MKPAKIGLAFKILVIVIILFSSVLTFLLFQDVRRIGERAQEVFVPSSDFGNLTNVTPLIIREDGEVVQWNLSLGSIQFKNLGKHVSIEHLRIKVDVVNETLDSPYLKLSSRKDISVPPGDTKDVKISLLIYRITFTKAVDFLFRALRWIIFQDVNSTYSNVSLDASVWNSSIFTATVFNKDLFEEIIVNGTILDEAAINDIRWNTLFDTNALNDSLVSNTPLNTTDLVKIDWDKDQLMNTIPGIGDFLGELLAQATIDAEIRLGISIMDIPFLKITIQPNEELFREIGGGM